MQQTQMHSSSNRRHKPQLKRLGEQTIVITGATSGIGLATARMAAKQGARLVLAARNEQALEDLVRELEASGHEAVGVEADVAREEDVRRIASTARERFGGFDTWINNAAVSMYGRLTDVPVEDERQLFETNYWGVVNGSRVAVEHLKERGGALINVGSANSDYAAPLQGTFSASKHAVKGYTDALRMEMEEIGAPVAVTLVKPSPTDTPYTRHARNHLDVEPQLTPPVYSPHVAARTILHCAEHPERDAYAGGGGKLFALAGRLAPRLTDRVMSKLGTRMQKRNSTRRAAASDSLYSAGADGQEHGDYEGHVMKSSAYSKATMNPGKTGALVLASGVVAGLLWRAHRRNNGRHLANGHDMARIAKKGRKMAASVPVVARDIKRSVDRHLPR